MNSTAAYASPYPVLEKRFVSSVLLAMLFVVIGLTFVTVVVGDDNSVLNTSGLMALLGPIAMFLLAWLGADQCTNKTSQPAQDKQSSSIEESDKSQYLPAWLGQH